MLYCSFFKAWCSTISLDWTLSHIHASTDALLIRINICSAPHTHASSTSINLKQHALIRACVHSSWTRCLQSGSVRTARRLLYINGMWAVWVCVCVFVFQRHGQNLRKIKYLHACTSMFVSASAPNCQCEIVSVQHAVHSYIYVIRQLQYTYMNVNFDR